MGTGMSNVPFPWRHLSPSQVNTEYSTSNRKTHGRVASKTGADGLELSLSSK
jgi:hypothetical protein